MPSQLISAETASVGDGAMPIKVGNFNGDGRPDLAFRSWALQAPIFSKRAISALSDGYCRRCDYGPAERRWWKLRAGPINTVIELDVPFDTYPGSLVADLNGDGKLDLIGTSLGSTPGVRSAFFLPGRGNGAFLQPREIQSGYVVATGDFNGDGIPDLVFGGRACISSSSRTWAASPATAARATAGGRAGQRWRLLPHQRPSQLLGLDPRGGLRPR